MAYRSGHYSRNLTTTSSDVTLNLLQLKGISFETAIIERYRRRESGVESACAKFSASTSSRPLSVFSALPRTNSLSCPLITSSLNCTIFSDTVCILLSEWCVMTSFYQRSANRVSFYPFFNLRNLFCLIVNQVSKIPRITMPMMTVAMAE